VDKQIFVERSADRHATKNVTLAPQEVAQA